MFGYGYEPRVGDGRSSTATIEVHHILFHVALATCESQPAKAVCIDLSYTRLGKLYESKIQKAVAFIAISLLTTHGSATWTTRCREAAG